MAMRAHALQVVKPEPRQKPVPDVGFAMIPMQVLTLADGYAIAVYASLARHANNEGVCWPSSDCIAAELGWSRPTIRKSIAKLVDAGVVIVEEQRRNGLQVSNRYTLPLRKSTLETSLPAVRTSMNAPLETTLPAAKDAGNESTGAGNVVTNAGKEISNAGNDVATNKNNVNQNQDDLGTTTVVPAQDAPQPPKEDPKPKVKTQSEADRMAFVLVDAYAIGSGRATKDVVARERYDARKAFEPLVDRFTADDIRGCTAWLKRDAFYQRGTLSPVHVAKAVGDWVRKGRPDGTETRRKQTANEAIDEFRAWAQEQHDDDPSVIEAKAVTR